MRWGVLIGGGVLCAVAVFAVFRGADRPLADATIGSGPSPMVDDQPAPAVAASTVPTQDRAVAPAHTSSLRHEAAGSMKQDDVLQPVWTRDLSQRVESAAAAGFTSSSVPPSTYMEDFHCNDGDGCGFVARVAEPEQVFRATSSLMKSVNKKLAEDPETRHLAVLLKEANPGQRMARLAIAPRPANAPCPEMQVTEDEAGQVESVSVEFDADGCQR